MSVPKWYGVLPYHFAGSCKSPGFSGVLPRFWDSLKGSDLKSYPLDGVTKRDPIRKGVDQPDALCFSKLRSKKQRGSFEM